MKKLVISLCTAAFILLGTGLVMAANDTTNHDVTINVLEVALVNAVGLDPAFTIDAPAGALGGEEFEVTSANEDNKWLQYTSIVGASGTLRKITVEINATGDTPPTGTTLHVTAAAPAGVGCGTLGAGSGPIDLSTTAADIVTGIGSGYTGLLANDGVQLTYGLDVDDCSALFADSYTVNVLYTMTESE